MNTSKLKVPTKIKSSNKKEQKPSPTKIKSLNKKEQKLSPPKIKSSNNLTKSVIQQNQ
jgi:hypothetical protein